VNNPLSKRNQKPQPSLQRGIVIANYGQHVEVEDENGHHLRCFARKNLPALVAGDQITWQTSDDNNGVVVAITPRNTELKRMESAQKQKVIAANIDMMIIVIAYQPLFSTLLIDRYLVAAECLGIQAMLLVNKSDLFTHDEQQELTQFATYQQLGYAPLSCSALKKTGIDQLIQQLENYTSVLVGQSGVGKSSLIATLLPTQDVTIGKLTQQQLGRHTTTTARLYHLPNNKGQIIDSPGVREFGLWHVTDQEIFYGFKEFRDYAGMCKFRNCQHSHEPGCAILQAVTEKNISAERLANYQQIMIR